MRYDYASFEDLQDYLNTKRNCWSPATLRSEGSRIKTLLPFITGRPSDLWNGIQTRGRYTRLTDFIRTSAFWKFINNGDDVYDRWKKENRNFFKNVYDRKAVGLSYEEAEAAIASIGSESVRNLARAILSSGQRYCESIQEYGRGYITGKGGKRRPDFRPSTAGVSTTKMGYISFYRHCKAAGFTPHDLRKLALTRAAANGAGLADLCEIAGWESLETAFHYLQPSKTEKLKGFLK